MGGGRHNDAAADALLLASTCQPSRSGVFILILTIFVCTHAKNTMLVSCANWRMYAGINYYVSRVATSHWLAMA